ncbi:hypothetical protein [Micromonospora sp. ATCC 39149]|uniref:WxL domain-containing protein n=1 Tax=Micromonospora carbonacea TaxID=47853 RepID=A0A7D5Y8F3_9ACTN|nr:hypothetical protein [Micromonospora sp. ATCC 39149]QLJ98419.1 hypothetical protein HZU44_27680 [Micromonospora carbonacea]
MKRTLAPVLCLPAAVILGVATPAAAQPSVDTQVTFTVATANLTIEAPSSVNLGSAFPGQRLRGPMGPVTVRDQRAAATATWTAMVVASDFRTGTGEPTEIIQAQLVEYWSGPATATTGTGTFVPGQPTEAQRVTLNQPRVAFSKTSGAGNNSATWNPTLEISIPSDAVGGLYTGTVTHSVS